MGRCQNFEMNKKSISNDTFFPFQINMFAFFQQSKTGRAEKEILLSLRNTSHSSLEIFRSSLIDSIMRIIYINKINHCQSHQV